MTARTSKSHCKAENTGSLSNKQKKFSPWGQRSNEVEFAVFFIHTHTQTHTQWGKERHTLHDFFILGFKNIAEHTLSRK